MANNEITNNDMMELAKLIAAGIIRDGADEVYVNASEEVKIEFCQAYAAAEVKKYDQFVTKMKTSSEAREAFYQLVLNIS